MTTEPQVIAGDSVHFYNPVDGSPVWHITGKNGRKRTPYVKEALALGLVPGVTTITKQVWSYGLQNYFVEQGIWAAVTNHQRDGETDDDYIARIKEESKEHATRRRDEGTELHKAIDQYILGGPFDTKWTPHVEAVTQALALHGYFITEGKPQVTFATAQYGGTADLVFPDAIWDWKTKDTLDGKKKLAYDDHGMQLVAYDRGIVDDTYERKWKKLFNVFVGCNDGAVQVYEWNDPKDIKRCWTKFQCLLGHWWADNQS